MRTWPGVCPEGRVLLLFPDHGTAASALGEGEPGAGSGEDKSSAEFRQICPGTFAGYRWQARGRGTTGRGAAAPGLAGGAR
jgi:hypothetical protein